MNGASISSDEVVGAIAGDRAELLELLLAKESTQTGAIIPLPRPKDSGILRVSASGAQQGLWFVDQLEGGKAGYHQSIAARLQGALNQEALRKALDTIVQRHEVLRARFVIEDGEPKQEVLAECEFVLKTVDLRGHEETEQRGLIRFEATEEFEEPFDLGVGPLVRGRLLQLKSETHVLFITMHHIVSDGWSLGVFARELTELYAAYSQGRDNPLRPLPIQYSDYTEWQQRWLRPQASGRQLNYWREQLRNAVPQLELPTDRPRPSVQSYHGDDVNVVLEQKLVTNLKLLAKRRQMTLYMILYAGWAILLSRLSGQDDVLIGTPIANRQRPELELLIGLFANVLVLRAEVRGELYLREFLDQVKETTLGAYENQDVPFEKLVEILRPQRDLSRHPIFQVGFGLQHTVPIELLQLHELTCTSEEEANGAARFDLMLTLGEVGDKLVGSVSYATDLFDRKTVDRWMASFVVILDSMIEGVDCRIADLNILPGNERQQVLELFNDTLVAYPHDKLVHELFEEQVQRMPQAVAVVYEAQSLTYAELNGRANQLARYLKAEGAVIGDCIPVLMSRSIRMLIAQLAVLKSGCTYLPIDPEIPLERREFMIRDCGGRILLTENGYRGVSSELLRVIESTHIDELVRQGSSSKNLKLNQKCAVSPAAYVMYTSGSTGAPKGVVVPHNAVNRLVINNGYADICAKDCIAHYSNPAFDASTFEIWGALLNGARALIVPQEIVLDSRKFAEEIKKQRVTVLWMSVGLFNQYADILAEVFPQLRYLIVGGDALSPETVRRVLHRGGPQHLLNGYGPTECTTFSTSYLIKEVKEGAQGIPIGSPIANAQVYILDNQKQPVPIGVTGELYIGGAGVARGYLNRPELTAERFVADPFGGNPQSRLYKTGDRGRWRPDGTIEFLGRNDDQVKIRGYRIELGEIESQLLRHAQVKEAVVLAREDVPGEKRLVAYVIAQDAQAAPSAEELRLQLKGVLPEYMVPSAFVVLEKLPLTPNGKLDRRALPEPGLGAYVGRQYEAPQGEVEEVLAGIWQELLHVNRVGRRDNFFELGGHSLLIVQMMERLRRVGLSTEARRVFESPILSDLASVLTLRMVTQSEVPPNGIPSGCEAITPLMLPLVELEEAHIERIVQWVPGGAANVQDIYPLAPLQEGILFHHLLNEQGGDIYARPLLLSLASREHLEKLTAALQWVIDRHDVLRTAVLWEQLPQPVQVVCRQVSLPVQQIVLDADRDALEQLLERMRPEHQRLDLRQAPLMRLQVAVDARGAHCYALLQTHHLVFDNGSLDILLSEVSAHLVGRTADLPDPVPYRNHVAQTLAHARAHDAEAFFRGKLGTVEEPTAPFGLLDIQGDGTRVVEAYQQLEPDLSQSIRAQARRLSVSAATLFHAAWGLVVACTACRDDVVFGSVLLGRLQGSAGSQRVLGMFINTLPLRLQLQGVTAQELVERTQRELVDLLSHEQASLAVAQRCSGIAGLAPLFSTLLNFRHSTEGRNSGLSNASGLTLLASEGRTNYPIVLSVDDLGEGFALTIETDWRIDPHRMLGYLDTALQSLVEVLEKSPRTPALLLPILSPSEQHQVIESFNATQVAYPKEKLIHKLFEEQVERTPGAVAVLYEGQSLSYAELNTQANQLAWYLTERGVGPDRLVGICVERGLEMMVGLLGILKAGGAYVPLDPSYPAERLAYMLNDASPKMLLTQERLRERVADTKAEVIYLDRQWKQIAQEPEINPQVGASRGEHLAYVIYTSGSTGQPKGVMVEHASLLNYLHWSKQAYRPEEGEGSVVASSLAFDATITSLYLPLLCGGAVTLVRDGQEVEGLEALLRQPRVWSLVKISPAHLTVLGQHWDREWECRVQAFVIGGEALSPTTVERWQELAPRTRLINEYGPTETVVGCSSYEIPPQSKGLSQISIGRPIGNVQMYLLDAHRRPVPIGVAGEIYVGGAGVARGYLNRSELTAERFVSDPYGADPQARMYRTGDLGRWGADGAIEYLGRNDHQVKIRGFRIELGEIESQLVRRAQVKEAVVIAREDVPGEKRLVAYVVPSDTLADAPAAEELRDHLKGVLPEHMVPSAFVVMAGLPLTANGKLDRRALPAPEQAAYVSRKYEAPQGEVEEILAGIWQGLLRVERVGRWDNFFELGGHSLLIVQLMERLRRVGLSTEVRRVFENPRLADLASVLTRGVMEEFEVPENRIPARCEAITPEMLPLVELEEVHIERIVKSVPGGVGNIQDIYPLAPLQEGILFHHLLDEQGGDIYARPMLLSLSSQERVEELIAALQWVIDRHDVLRTAVLWEQLPQAVQVVYRQASLLVQESVLDPDRDAREQVQEWLQPERQRLDLRQAPLMRLRVAADPRGGKSYALMQTHHLIFDNQSLDIFLSEVSAHLQGQTRELPKPVPYRNHVAQALAHARAHDAEAFFRSKLGEIEEPTAPFGVLDVQPGESRIAKVYQPLDLDLSHRIRVQARRLSVSAATLFHAAWGLVVGRTAGRDDVVFGSVLLGRLQGSAGAQRILGMFINTLPLRLRLQGVTAQELVVQTQRELVELLTHEQASLAVAQRCSGITGSAPLFSTLLNYLHSSVGSDSGLAGVSGVELLASEARTNYPILLSVDDLGEGFALTMETVWRIDGSRMLGYVQTALQSLVEALEKSPQTPVLMLSILPPSERQQVIELFNARQVSYPQEKLIHELFEEQVERTPEAVSVVYEGQWLSYGELNARANQLASYLRAKGVGSDQLVGICVERSLEMVVGLLGILKSGGAYVPLDPGYPPERLAYMLEDAAPKVLLILEPLREKVPQTTAELIALDWDCGEIARQAVDNPNTRALGQRSHHLAYVIYTSGSTGNPKGVMIEHRNVARLFAATAQWFRFDERDVWTLFHSFAFDFSVWELWGALLYGGRLIIVPYLTARSPQDFYQLLCNEGVTVLNQTPSAFVQLIDAQAQNPAQRHVLREVIFGGEALELRTLRPWVERNGARLPQLVNMYGITETTVHVTYRPLSEEEIESGQGSPVGKPIPDLRAYLLDSHRQPVPIGVVGEIFIGGAGVARGYLNRPELTEKRFVSDPYSADPQARMYRTGDLGRWRADGTIEYLGRSDHQVKIRGFRIELGEIEAQLLRHAQVKEAVVLAREDVPGEKRLVAYVVSANAPAVGFPTVEVLRGHLIEVLPEHMVPSAIVVLASLPLTANGKLDRRALPAPEKGAYVSRQYEVPQGEVEKILAGIWQGLLRVERVGRWDNFFELGGDSIRAISVLSRAKESGVELSVRDIFRERTLRDIAGVARSNLGMLPLAGIKEPFSLITDKDRRALPKDIEDAYPLSALQSGMLFHSELEGIGSSIYHDVFSYEIQGDFRAEIVQKVIQQLIDCHKSLRTSIWLGIDEPRIQRIHKNVSAIIATEDISNLDEDRQKIFLEEFVEHESHSDFSWENPPLMRFFAHKREAGRFQVTFSFHHLILDGWSVASLVTEFVRRYATLLAGSSSDQTVHEDVFKEFIILERAALQSEDTRKFWLRQLSENTFLDSLTEQNRSSDTKARELQNVKMPLSADLSRQVRELARHLGTPLKSILLAVYAKALGILTNKSDITVGVVFNGRPERTGGVEALGLFLNSLPITIHLKDESWASLIGRVFDEETNILPHRRFPLFELQRLNGGSRVFDILFNYTNFHVYDDAENFDGVRIVDSLASETTNYSLLVNGYVEPVTHDIGLTIIYDSMVFEEQKCRLIASLCVRALEMLVEDPLQSHTSRCLMSDVDRYEVIHLFNAAQSACPQDKLIHELFEKQVERTPNAVAVVYEREALTYAELNVRANQLARYLREKGVGPDQLVGICVERSLEMVVGLLGIMKAGGAYIPLDPGYPPERLVYMLSDADPKVLLIHEKLRSALSDDVRIEMLSLDGEWHQVSPLSSENISTKSLGLKANNLAYVIYTSGSTGQPKGVMIEHRNVLILRQGLEELHGKAGECWRIAVNAPFNFDASVQQVLQLLRGSTLFVVPQEYRLDANRMVRFVDDNWIHGVDCTPSQLKLWLASGLLTQKESGLKVVLVGGEAIDPNLWISLSRCEGVGFYNVYGPTECTVDATVAVLRGDTGGPHIGRPMENRQIYILGLDGWPVPIRISGEIYIGGAGVGRGYLNRPELTAERFIADPFSADPQARLYKTGDLGRWRPDGTIEYLGRNDHQVKIRGFRIELGEIEAQLLRQAQVKEAVVLVREDVPGEKRLVAYVIAQDAQAAPSAEELRLQLRGVLPEYMVPSAFVVLEKLPLTPNGKLDRRALPEPGLGAYVGRQYEAPQGEVEELLVGIWQELLRVNRVGRHDNFFELGGHSLLAMSLISKIAEQCLVRLSGTAVFKYPTIAQMAQVTEAFRAGNLRPKGPDKANSDTGVI